MQVSEKTGNEIHQILGKLFYAIAVADKKVVPEEMVKLKEDVRKYWLSSDEVKDEFGSDAAYKIEDVFDGLRQPKNANGPIEAGKPTVGESDKYFEEFAEFFKAHPSKFTDVVKKSIWRTADDIAASYAGKNKSELILLAKLKMLLSA